MRYSLAVCFIKYAALCFIILLSLSLTRALSLSVCAFIKTITYISCDKNEILRLPTEKQLQYIIGSDKYTNTDIHMYIRNYKCISFHIYAYKYVAIRCMQVALIKMLVNFSFNFWWIFHWSCGKVGVLFESSLIWVVKYWKLASGKSL